jgi:Fe-S cluster assembly protein SufD
VNIAVLPAAQASSAAGFLARYDGLTARLPGDSEPRRASAEILRKAGLPSLRDEMWRYTSLASLSEIAFHEPLTQASGFEPDRDLPALGALADVPRLVFVQGRFSADQSRLPELAGVQSFAATAAFGTLAKPERDRLVALNTMLAEDGAVIEIAEGVDAETLVLVSCGHDIQGTALAYHPRHQLRLHPGANLTLVEIATGHGQYLHNPVSEIELGRGARLTHVRLQNEGAAAFHLATIYVDLAEGATYDGFTLSTGARVSRTEMHIRLSGTGAHASAHAAQLLRGHQHSDLTSVISHDAPNCKSRQAVKHVLADHARGVFQGRIEVARPAQKTDGYQMNQALLLSPDAEIDCKPQLEIFADDVKCSHGATVGELDADQLFYLVSRGIPRAEARGMLVRAFLGEALDLMTDDDARALLERVVDDWWKHSS